MNTKFFKDAQMISPLSDKHRVIKSEKYHHKRYEELSQCSFVKNEFIINEIPEGCSGELILNKYTNITVNNIDKDPDNLIINQGKNIINFSLIKK